MRVINLDETGVKIIASTKKQMYLSIEEIQSFIAKKYRLHKNTLLFADKQLILSDKDVIDFPNIYDYIEANFGKNDVNPQK